MSSEIIQSVAYDNYDDFQHVNFILSQNFISLFWGLFIDETDLSLSYENLNKDPILVSASMFKTRYLPQQFSSVSSYY
jgi:hypothetical protein